MDLQLPPLPVILAEVFILFFGVGLHEYAHCKFADMAGDPTPGIRGRVTLDLTKHFELSGTMMMAFTMLTGYGIGWGKPAPVDPRKMKNPRWDFFASTLAGPVTNLIQAVIYALFFRLAIGSVDVTTDEGLFLRTLLTYGVAINLGLFCFNLIPFGPLDGHWLFGLLMPEKPRYYWFRFNRQLGVPALFVVVVCLQYYRVPLTAGPVSYLFRILTGQDL